MLLHCIRALKDLNVHNMSRSRRALNEAFTALCSLLCIPRFCKTVAKVPTAKYIESFKFKIKDNTFIIITEEFVCVHVFS